MLKVTDTLIIPYEEFDISFARSSGPGGQNVNKRETKAVLSWNPKLSPSLPESVRTRFLDLYSNRISEDGHIVIACDEHRSQEMNLKGCYEKLYRMILAIAVPPKVRRPTKPTKGSKARRLNEKKVQGDTKKMRQKVNSSHE